MAGASTCLVGPNQFWEHGRQPLPLVSNKKARQTEPAPKREAPFPAARQQNQAWKAPACRFEFGRRGLSKPQKTCTMLSVEEVTGSVKSPPERRGSGHLFLPSPFFLGGQLREPKENTGFERVTCFETNPHRAGGYLEDSDESLLQPNQL